MSNKNRNYYEVLNLKKDCKPEDIKKSFILLSKEFHPDKNSSKDAHEKFIRINDAYTTLSNPVKRKLYDAQLSTTANNAFNAGRTENVNAYTSRKQYHNNYNYNAWNRRNKSGSKLFFRLVLLPQVLIATTLVITVFFSRDIEAYFLNGRFDARKKVLHDANFKTILRNARAKRYEKKNGKEDQLKRFKEEKLGAFSNSELLDDYIREKKKKRFKSE